MRLRLFVKPATLLVVGLVALPAFAGEGRVPIYQDPTVITANSPNNCHSGIVS